MNSIITDDSYTQIHNEEESFERVLKIIGSFFLISFFFPIFADKKFYVLNIYLLNKTEDSPGLIILLLLPAIYGLLVLVLPTFVKNKTLSISMLSISLFPFIYLLAKTDIRENFITSLNIFKGLWLLVFANVAMFIASKNINNASKGMLAKVIGLIGGVTFLVYLFISYELPLPRNISNNMMILEMPFKLIDLNFVLTGIVMLTFYVLLSVVAIRLIVIMLNQKPLSSNFGEITTKIFIAAWLVYLIGMFIATLSDIAINTSKFYSPKPEFYFSTATVYVKAVLYFFPIIMLLLLSASKVFNDFTPKDNQTMLDTMEAKQNSYSYNSNVNIFRHQVGDLKKYNSISLNQQGKGSIIIDTGKLSVAVFVNGTKVSSNGSCRVTGLEPGEYHIRVEGRDCYSEEENIYLSSENEPVTVKPKINLLARFKINSEYKNVSFRIENLAELKPGQEIYLRAGKYKIKPSQDYLPTLETTISEGEGNILDYDIHVPKSTLIIKCEEEASEIEVHHQDTGKATILDVIEKNSITILPGLIKLILKSGRTVITKNIIVKSEQFSVDFTEKLTEAKEKNKKIIILVSVSIAIAVISTILIVMIPIWNENSAWTTAKEKNTEFSYEEYLANYPDGNYIDEARKAMELSLWMETKKLDTEVAYWNFINKYPSGFHTNESRRLVEPKYWERIKSIDTEKAYREYLQTFPNGNYREEASHLLNLSEVNLKNFVRTVINYENQKDILGLINFYSDKVNYFSSGNVSKNFIIQDKQNYFKKWDNINYQFNDNISVEKTKDPFTKIVRYNLGFYVYSSEKKMKIEGITQNSLNIKYENGSLKIVDQKGKIISQEKTEY